MGKARTTYVFAGALSLSLLSANARADLLISDWELTNQVLTPPWQNYGLFTTVENPFVAAHTAALSGSTSSVDYNFSWSGDGGTFRIDFDGQAVELPGGSVFSAAFGYIHFTTTSKIAVTLSGALTFDLPGYLMRSEQIAEVFGPPNEPDYVSFANYIGPTSGPIAGTTQEIRQTVLPANCDCTFQYYMDVATIGDSGATGSAFGYVSLELAPVPEPAAFLPLALGALLLRRRRTR
jgi:hypothetical protein